MCRKLSFASDPFQETQNKANKTEKLCRLLLLSDRGKDFHVSETSSNFCNMEIKKTHLPKLWKMGYSDVQDAKTLIRGGIHLHSLLFSNAATEAQSSVCEVAKEIWIPSEFLSIPRPPKFTPVILFLHVHKYCSTQKTQIWLLSFQDIFYIGCESLVC